MVDGVGIVADEAFNLRVSLRRGRCVQLPAAQRRQRGLLQDAAHQLEAPHQAGHVVGMGQKIGVDDWRGHRVGTGQAHTAAALRLQQTHMAGIAVAKGGLAPVVEQLADHKMQLQIRRWLALLALDEAARFGKIGRQHPGTLLAPFQNALERAQQPAGRDAKQILEVRRVHHLHHVHMVVQILAHAGQVVQHRDTKLLQMRARPNAGQLQHLG